MKIKQWGSSWKINRKEFVVANLSFAYKSYSLFAMVKLVA